MNSIIRGIIIYVTVVIAVRLMGKRQIGELQPGELVITILLSEVASMPLQGDNYPLPTSIILIFLFVSLEIISSVISLKSNRYRNLIQGNSMLIIQDGILLEDNLRKLRYSIDDILASLRMKDIFDISQVQYAYIETNGSMSICLKAAYSPATPSDMKLKVSEKSLPCLVVCDGQIINRELNTAGITEAKIRDTLKKEKVNLKEVLLMTAEKSGKINIIKKNTKG